MKNYVLIILISLGSSFAQNEVSQETSNLQQAQDAALGQGGTFGTIGFNVNPNLTDEEQNTVNTFFHDGLADELLRTECAKEENKDACTDESAYVFNRSTDVSIEALSKLLSVFSLASGSAGGGAGALTGSSSNSASAGKVSKVDYCGYIPAGTEAAAQYYQQAQQQQIAQDLALPDTLGQPDSETPANQQQTFVNNQRESVFALIRSHKTREQSAQIQYGGWGVTAGCYGVQLAGRGLQGAFDPWAIVKGAAATGLASFYKKKYEKQKRFKGILQNLADKLPGVGDCNPVTERQCYCTHPTTANDPKYCLPQILAARANDNNIVVNCVNNLLEDDPECNCVATNSCFDQTFRDLTLSGVGTNSNAQLLQQTSNVLRGNLAQGGELASLTNAQLAKAQGAIARATDKAKNLKLTARALNDNEQEQANFLQSLGVPNRLASHFAAQPFDSKAQKAAKKLKSKRRSSYKGYSRSKRKKNGTNVIRFGRGLKNNSRSTARKKSRFNKLNKLKNRKQASSNVLKFSSQATAKAQITRDTSKPIFQIISRRYQVSGWQRLEMVGKNLK